MTENSLEAFTTTRTKKKLQEKVAQEKQVIVHCVFNCTAGDTWIRIWPSTYLIAKDVSHRSELVIAENIPLAPEWTLVANGTTLNFTLIFCGLPHDCTVFDMVEEIPQPGGFEVSGINRNGTDVYTINL